MRDNKAIAQPLGIIDTRFRSPSHLPYSLFAYCVFQPLGIVTGQTGDLATVSISLIEEWYLDRRLRKFLTKTGMHPGEAQHLVDMVRLSLELRDWFDLNFLSSEKNEVEIAGLLFEKAVSIPGVRRIFGENWWEGNRYINKEGFEYSLLWFLSIGLLDILRKVNINQERVNHLLKLNQILTIWKKTADEQGYNVEKMLGILLPKRAEIATPKNRTQSNKKSN